MARTKRNLPHWAKDLAEFLRDPSHYRPQTAKDRAKKAARMESGADGSLSFYVFGSAKNGRLDTWDDVGKGAGKAGKRLANKQIRRWHKNETKRQAGEGED